jgi:hypothetical protein
LLPIRVIGCHIALSILTASSACHIELPTTRGDGFRHASSQGLLRAGASVMYRLLGSLI